MNKLTDKIIKNTWKWEMHPNLLFLTPRTFIAGHTNRRILASMNEVKPTLNLCSTPYSNKTPPMTRKEAAESKVFYKKAFTKLAVRYGYLAARRH